MMQFIRTSTMLLKTLSSTTPVLKCNNSLFSMFSNIKSSNSLSFNVKPCQLASGIKIGIPNRSIFIHRTGDQLWEGVIGAPGRAKKRARGKRRVVRNKVDLNFGRRLGENLLNYKYPGLNTPVYLEGNVMRRSVGEEDKNYWELLTQIRNRQNKRRMQRSVPPLKRGWCGSKMGGQSLGKPEPVIGQDWTGYDSRILEVKVVSTMTASKGRTGRFSTVVMVGNGQGLAGIGKAKSKNMRTALRMAKKRATKRFEFYELRESRTLWHPDYVLDRNTGLFAKPMPEGSGLICHRLIKTMCQMIGIKDMYAKAEGAVKNYQTLARTFTTLLRKQETYQDLSNRLELNVVEFRPENDNYPHLLAAPAGGLTRDPLPDDPLEFERLHMDGRVFWPRRYRPFYLNSPGVVRQRHLRHRYRNMDAIERSNKVVQYLADQGQLNRRDLTNQSADGVAENK